jgi:VIT1/CCC1 family predicted Fe2+/Mn2+ transporter
MAALFDRDLRHLNHGARQARASRMIWPTRISFGGTAAIVTSMALIAGLDAANARRATIVSALLIAAVADNLTDSLSVHMYQESERLEQRQAFFGTLTNFATRFIVCLTFVLIAALFQEHAVAVVGIVWGMSLLAALTYLLARHRKVSTMPELGKHLAVALVVIFVSKGIGHWITAHVT